MDAHRVYEFFSFPVVSRGCLELKPSLKWKLCKWKVLLVTAETFKRVPFHAGHCPDPSHYCTPANSSDPNSPKRQISSVIRGFLYKQKRIWQTSAGERMCNTWQWLSTSLLSHWTEHRTKQLVHEWKHKSPKGEEQIYNLMKASSQRGRFGGGSIPSTPLHLSIHKKKTKQTSPTTQRPYY